MPRNLDFTDEAAGDLAAMRCWYSQPGAGAAAKRRAQAIVDAIERLRDMPCLPARGRRPGTCPATIRMVLSDNQDG